MTEKKYILYRAVAGNKLWKIAGHSKEDVLAYLRQRLNLTQEETGLLELNVLSKDIIIAKHAGYPVSVRKIKSPRSYFEIPVNEIFDENNSMSRKVKGLLGDLCISNLGQLLETSPEELISKRSYGRKTLEHIKSKINGLGMQVSW